MSEPHLPEQHPVDPDTGRRIEAAFTALLAQEVPASAPRPTAAPRPVDTDTRITRRRIGIAGGGLLVAAAAVLVALLVGGEVQQARPRPSMSAAVTDPTTPTGTTTGTPTGPPSTVATTPPASTPTAVVPPSGASTSAETSPGAGSDEPGLCTPTVMTFSVTDLHPAAGSAFFEVHAVNGSAQSCVTTGFPGLALLDGAGRQILQADRDGYLAPTTIVVAPGQEVVSRVQASDVPRGGSSSCPTSPAFVLTLPDNTDPTTITHTTPACGVQVRAFVRSTG